MPCGDATTVLVGRTDHCGGTEVMQLGPRVSQTSYYEVMLTNTTGDCASLGFDATEDTKRHAVYPVTVKIPPSSFLAASSAIVYGDHDAGVQREALVPRAQALGAAHQGSLRFSPNDRDCSTRFDIFRDR